jgi:hypothetical protein
MTSPAQIEANRRNGSLSTGPTTAEGKTVAARNATRHGLRSAAAVLPGEDPAEWEAHQAGILQSLAPVGALEENLAQRVALSLWRLRRAAAYETAVTVAGLEEVPDELRQPALVGRSDHEKLEKTLKDLEDKRKTVRVWEGTLHLLERLPGLPDPEPVDPDEVWGAFQDLLDQLPEQAEAVEVEGAAFLTGLGIPRDEQDQAYQWGGWTAGLAKKGLARIAQAARLAPERLLARAVRTRQETQEENRAKAKQLEREAKELRRRLREREGRLRQRRMLPDGNTLERLTRYEAHLQRQMLQALHELQRLQAARSGEGVPPPAALDVTVDAPAEPAAAALEDLSGR